jgi:hypothetical protein
MSVEKESTKLRKVIISRLVTPPQAGVKAMFWPREMKISKELVAKYNDPDFWSRVDFGFKVNSLAWFKTADGIKRLEAKIKEFKFVPKEKEEEIPLFEEKFGETSHNIDKPKTLRDFLR